MTCPLEAKSHRQNHELSSGASLTDHLQSKSNTVGKMLVSILLRFLKADFSGLKFFSTFSMPVPAAVTFAVEGLGEQQGNPVTAPIQQLDGGTGCKWCLWGEMESQTPLTAASISFLLQTCSSALGKFKFALSAEKSHAGAEHFRFFFTASVLILYCRAKLGFAEDSGQSLKSWAGLKSFYCRWWKKKKKKIELDFYSGLSSVLTGE